VSEFIYQARKTGTIARCLTERKSDGAWPTVEHLGNLMPEAALRQAADKANQLLGECYRAGKSAVVPLATPPPSPPTRGEGKKADGDARAVSRFEGKQPIRRLSARKGDHDT
jgi:hypothetical protein